MVQKYRWLLLGKSPPIYMVLCGEKTDGLLWCTLDGLMVKGQSMTKDGCEWCKSTAWGLPYKDGLNGAMIWHEDGMV